MDSHEICVNHTLPYTTLPNSTAESRIAHRHTLDNHYHRHHYTNTALHSSSMVHTGCTQSTVPNPSQSHVGNEFTNQGTRPTHTSAFVAYN